MSLFSPLLLASATLVPPPYPADAVLTELKSVCLEDYRVTKTQGSFGSTASAVQFWIETARQRGWQEFSDQSSDVTTRDKIAWNNLFTLNRVLFGSFVSLSGYSQGFSDKVGEMFGGQIFKRVVGGRVVYLSVFGAEDDGGRSVGECRIHDPLGDVGSKELISSGDVSRFAGEKTRKMRGPFGSRKYVWVRRRGEFSELDVHMSFKGWGLSPFSSKIEQFDPYAPYGLNLVVGFHEQEIIV